MRRGRILNLNESLNKMECDPGGGGGGGGEGSGSKFSRVVNRLIDMDRIVLIKRVGRLRYNGLSAMLVLGMVVIGLIGGGGCFVVSEGGSSSTTPKHLPSVPTEFPVLVGDISVSQVNKTEEDSGNENVEEVNKKPPITVTNLIGNGSLEDLGVGGGMSSTSTTEQPLRESEKGEEDGNCTRGDENVVNSVNKIEQILWDIFVEEDDDSAHDDLEEDDEETLRSDNPVTNEKAKDQEESSPAPDSSESTFEDMLSDSIALHEHEHAKDTVHHGISKRSVVQEEEGEEDVEVGRSDVRRHHPVAPSHPHKQNRGNKKNARPTNKKYNRPQQPHGGSRSKGQHRVSSRRHTRPNTKKKAPTNVGKYNDYMDVVLKRMNSMIKTKHMDPLMVNLFSGGQQPGKPAKPQDKPKDPPKKKKKGYTGRKKRKGAKNKGRMEELHEVDVDDDEDMEARSVSSSESSTVELDGVNGVQGIGGVLIRRVGVLEDVSSGSDEEELDDEGGEDDDGDEDGEERGFREIRALIVNGSMKRSNGESSLNDTESSSEPSTSATSTSTQSPKKSSTETTSPQETRGFDKSPSSAQNNGSSEESSRKKDSNKNKNNKNKKDNKKKQAEKKPTPKPKKKSGRGKATRGVLKGLSSLKRYGDVDVVRQTDNVRIVRGRFKLGPVTLEIVPKGGSAGSGKGEEEGRKKGGGKNKQKSSSSEETKPSTPKPAPKVTAVARELKGIIEVRLKKNSPTTIKRLRVFPPSSVKIKSNGKSPSEKPKGSSVPRYNRVTPVATHRLRQIASAVVRQADVKRKSSGLGKGKVKS